MNFKQGDVFYVTLPFYHRFFFFFSSSKRNNFLFDKISAGGVLGAGIVWQMGSTFVSRAKFSVSNFWRDCSEHDVTVIQYIGELCRYLLHAPPSELDKKHKVRLGFGNGLRPDIWTQFTERFGISEINEWYSATEGTITLWNNRGKVGAVG
jgi:acyl-CoA synthetase (AMP-forming)/AMP-acid ligase II